MSNDIKRAQIFQSFDALKGFRELLKEQERILVPKKELSEYDYEILDRKIKCIHPSMIVTLIYNDKNDTIQVKGMVSKINFDTKIIQIVKLKLSFDQIIDIQGVDLFDNI